MEISIPKKHLLRGLARTHAVADRKSSMPILSNVLLNTDGKGGLRLAATDLYVAIAATAPASIKTEGGVAVSARTLFDIVKNLPEGEVTLSTGPAHAVELRCGKVRYKIPGMPPTEFPALPTAGEAKPSSVDADALASLIARTQYSMSADETRPHLAASLLESNGTVIRMVTTDGHRLSKAEAPSKAATFTMLIPSKGVAELKRLLEDARAERPKGEDGPSTVSVAIANGNAFFARDGVSLSVRLSDEQFPPYEKVIPAKSDRRVVIPRSALLDSLRRIALVASDRSGGVRLSLESGKLKVTSENPDVGEGSEELDVDFAGDALVIGFNAKYVIDVLAALVEDDVALELSGELDPGVIRPASNSTFVGVVMPMRI